MLAAAVRSAAERNDVAVAIAQVYADLQREMELRRPVCSTSGRCCRFDEFGHRLYVTTLELAAFVRSLNSAGAVSGVNGCPFQIDGLCSVHPIRPFGCRVFFCDATATEWQQVQYEVFHSRLKRLHDELDVPYFYVEWRQALEALGLLNAAGPQQLNETAGGKSKSLSLPQLPL